MEVEFIEDGHIYLCDGIVTPSCSAVLNYIFPDTYSNIPRNILNAKASLGTNVHAAIEADGKEYEVPKLSIEEQGCFDEWLRLKKENNINPVHQEMLVHYKDIFCGTLDMIADINYYRVLADIKTTAEVHQDRLSWQLSLYKLALEDMGYEDVFESLQCIWLPKHKPGKLIQVKEVDRNLLLRKLDEFREYWEAR